MCKLHETDSARNHRMGRIRWLGRRAKLGKKRWDRVWLRKHCQTYAVGNRWLPRQYPPRVCHRSFQGKCGNCRLPRCGRSPIVPTENGEPQFGIGNAFAVLVGDAARKQDHLSLPLRCHFFLIAGFVGDKGLGKQGFYVSRQQKQTHRRRRFRERFSTKVGCMRVGSLSASVGIHTQGISSYGAKPVQFPVAFCP